MNFFMFFVDCNNTKNIFIISLINKMKSINKIEINIDLYNKPIIPKKKAAYAKMANPKGNENIYLSRLGRFKPINFKILCPSAIAIITTKIK